MLICALCCSFRAVRLLLLILLQQNSLKKPPFFLDALSQGVGVFFMCPLCCPAQLGGSLVTICLPRLRPAGVRSSLLLQGLPCCCSLHPAAMGSALWWSLSVVAGCLSNGRLCQQWECISVGADCLSNGGCPSPTELQCPGFSCAHTQSVWNCCFVCPTALAQTPFPWNLLAWLTVQVLFNQMDMPICPLKSQIAGSTGHPDLCALCGELWSAAALQLRPPAAPAAGCSSQNCCTGVPRLFYTWEFPRSVGNKDTSGNAALTHPPRVH